MVNDRPNDAVLLGYDSILAWTIASEDSDPEGRDSYAVAVNAAWGLLGVVCAFVMVGTGYVTQVVFGGGVADVVVGAWFGCGAFCFAGCANVLWRKYYYVNQAKRRARKFGRDSERYKISMRRALPRNSSLVFQLVIGIVGVVWLQSL